MRLTGKLIIIFSAVTALFNSCKNDLKILAPYKESMSVYAILTSQESAPANQFNINSKYHRQYVRINKIYLGEGNAYEMAQVNDSVNYRQGVLRVSLTRTLYGNAAPTTVGSGSKYEIVFNDTVIQMAPGPFNQNQRLWYTDDSLYSTGDYYLKIKNTVTGAEFNSKTTMISAVLQPGIFQPLGSPYYPVAFSPSNPAYYYLDLSVTSLHRTIKFNSVPNGRDYSCIMRFNYIDSTGSGNIPKVIDYEFGRISSVSLTGSEPLEFDYNSGDYFNFLYSEIAKNGDPTGFLARRAVNIEYIITAASQDFADFIKISAPSTSIAQDKPTYSNIDNGAFGIFSCRSTYRAPKQLANATLDHLASKKPLCDLRFVNSAGNISPTCN
jgi:hypothetical protein